MSVNTGPKGLICGQILDKVRSKICQASFCKAHGFLKQALLFYLWFTKDYVQQPIQYQSLNLKSLQSPSHQNISHGFISTNNEVNGRRIWPKPKQKPHTPLFCTK